MSTYEAAPGTTLVATSCCACGRALLDAQSLAMAMGPDCRERYGVEASLSETERVTANGAIHRLAMADHGDTEAPALLATLRRIGFGDLCDRIEERLVRATIASYRLCPGAPESLRLTFATQADPAGWGAAAKSIPGLLRREAADEVIVIVPILPSSQRALLVALAQVLPGKLARGRHGLFVIPAASAATTARRAA